MKSSGIIASEGIGIGNVIILKQEEIVIEKSSVSDTDLEITKFLDAIKNAVEELTTLHEKVKTKLDEKEAQIFSAHRLICEDVEIINATKDMITNEKVCCEYAYKTVIDGFIAIFSGLDDEYMRERVADLKDVSNRVFRKILNISEIDLTNVDEDSIVVADDLTPSQTSQLNSFVKGFITMVGGKTSHSAIIARSLDLPAIVGVGQDISLYENAKQIVVDAINNEIVIDPSNEEIEKFHNISEEFLKEKELWLKQIGKKVSLKSGKEIIVAANVATEADIEYAKEIGADGIGLLRTEFLYMETKDLPSEEKQYNFYKKALDAFPNQKVVIRTLDIGGDKNHEYFDVGEELNPFLGVRAIRLCFKYIDVFKTQIRALLRANSTGNLCVMFPMIATIEEFLEAKEVVKTCYDELVSEGIEVCDKYELGTMVEIPAVAIIADEFAKHVDFFSIGTNDLIQYTMASDRMNQDLNYLYQPMNLAILTLIRNVINAGKSHGKWVGMCGEMAADISALDFLTDLEIDELSMNNKSVLRIKHEITKLK